MSTVLERESRDYVFCESYVTLFLALDMLDRGRDVTVITNSVAIVRSCTQLDVPVLELTLGPSPQRSSERHFSAMLQLRRIPQWLRANVGAGHTLYFSHTQYSLTAFALAHAWADLGDVYLWDVEQTYPRTALGLSGGAISARIRRGLIQAATGVAPLETRDVGLGPVASIGDDFLDRHGIRRLPVDPPLGTVRDRVARSHHVPLERTAALLCTQPLGDQYPIVRTSLDSLYSALARHDVTVKRHPRDTSLPEPLEGLRTYPSHLPAELLLGNVTNAVLALHSSVLLTAAAFPHLKSICLVELVEWTDLDVKRGIVEFIEDMSGSSVLLPRSLDELEQLLL